MFTVVRLLQAWNCEEWIKSIKGINSFQYHINIKHGLVNWYIVNWYSLGITFQMVAELMSLPLLGQTALMLLKVKPDLTTASFYPY